MIVQLEPVCQYSLLVVLLLLLVHSDLCIAQKWVPDPAENLVWDCMWQQLVWKVMDD